MPLTEAQKRAMHNYREKNRDKYLNYMKERNPIYKEKNRVISNERRLKQYHFNKEAMRLRLIDIF